MLFFFPLCDILIPGQKTSVVYKLKSHHQPHPKCNTFRCAIFLCSFRILLPNRSSFQGKDMHFPFASQFFFVHSPFFPLISKVSLFYQKFLLNSCYIFCILTALVQALSTFIITITVSSYLIPFPQVSKPKSFLQWVVKVKSQRLVHGRPCKTMQTLFFKNGEYLKEAYCLCYVVPIVDNVSLGIVDSILTFPLWK